MLLVIHVADLSTLPPTFRIIGYTKTSFREDVPAMLDIKKTL